ncbi:MAG: diphthamide biosynthesis enzyme Dph2 [archaeon]|nr:diphthamide biosynthesis enzyme Dph2 [archaeon]
MLDLRLEEVKKEIAKRNAQTIIVQVPEGLKPRLTEILSELSKTGAEVFAAMDPCFGACDLPLDKMNALNADLLVHFGHAPIHRPQNAMYVPVYDRVPEKTIKTLVTKAAGILKEKKIKKIALCTHSQFIYLLESVGKKFEEKGFEVLVGDASPRIAFKGQVLGCNYTTVTSVADKIDAAVYIGEGHFHPLGLALSVNKPVFFLDTSTQKVQDFSNELDRYKRKRFAAITIAKDCKNFGILVSTKTGQRYKQVALHCKKMLEEAGKNAFLLSMDLVKEDYMAGVKVDCFVNTACTRIVGDDAEHWKKPIINPLEVEIVIGKRAWEDFAFDVLY